MIEKQTTLVIDGIPIEVDGEGDDVLLMVHGWPDTARLWDAQVAHFRSRYRCARFTLPGFDVALPPRTASVETLCDFIRRVCSAVSPGRPVLLMIHDWGAIFGFEFAQRHPEHVARIVAIDVADATSGAWRREVGWRALLAAVTYQLWLMAAFYIGRHLHAGTGDRMTRWMARVMRAPSPPQHIGWGMNHPYAMAWSGLEGGLELRRIEPVCPVFFAWGTRKPFMFHSRRWIERLAADPRCHAQAFHANHWVMVKAADEFNTAVSRWLQT